jgi:hypothetical protein
MRESSAKPFAGTYVLPGGNAAPALGVSTTVDYDAETKKLTVHYAKDKYSLGYKRVLSSKYEGKTSHYIGQLVTVVMMVVGIFKKVEVC